MSAPTFNEGDRVRVVLDLPIYRGVVGTVIAIDWLLIPGAIASYVVELDDPALKPMGPLRFTRDEIERYNGLDVILDKTS